MALISLRMLLESPNPKDPQDAEVARMMMENPAAFAQKAHDWAVRFAGAPRKDDLMTSYQTTVQATPQPDLNDPNRYVFSYDPLPPLPPIPGPRHGGDGPARHGVVLGGISLRDLYQFVDP